MDIEDLLWKYTQSIDPCGRTRIGACLVHKKRIIAFGNNKYKTHPIQRKFGRNEKSIFLHAEVDTIIKGLNTISCNSFLHRSSLYLLRIRRGSPKGIYHYGLSKPCIGCQKFLSYFDIGQVYYTTNEGTWEQLYA